MPLPGWTTRVGNFFFFWIDRLRGGPGRLDDELAELAGIGGAGGLGGNGGDGDEGRGGEDLLQHLPSPG